MVIGGGMDHQNCFGTYNDWVKVDSVHVEPLDLLQVSVLGLGAAEAGQPRMGALDPGLEVLGLRGEEPELWHVARLVHLAIIVANIRWNEKMELGFVLND